MKKNELLKAVDSKKKKNQVPKKKKTTKKTIKKEKIKLKEIKQENNKEIKKEEPKEIINTTKEEIIQEPKEELTLKKKTIKLGIKILVILLTLLFLILLFYRITEYKPEKTEKIPITGEGFYSLNEGDSFTIMTWNIGYGALGDNADSYKENGKMVQTADRNRLNYNLNGIRTKIDENKPNIILFQEIDKNSKRVNHVDEVSSFQNHLNNYSVAFATNYKVKYLAYPINDRVGNVHSGLATFSKYTIESAKRVQLYNSNIWPLSMVREKKCLLITYIPIKDSEKKLVIINIQFDKIKTNNKSKQIEELKKVMQKEQKKGNYVIVGGDFKQTFANVDDSEYPILNKNWEPGKIEQKEIGKEWNLLMDNKVPSNRSLDKPYKDAKKEKFQYYIIDGYIISNNITVEEYHTADYEFEYANHNPVIMKVTVNKEEISE